MKIIFFAVGILLSSFASANAPLIAETLNYNDSVIQSLKNEEFAQLGQETLNSLIDKSVLELNAKGFSADAEQLNNEWYGYYSLSYNLRDLGDHRPLSRWLVETYKKLRMKLGDANVKKYHLDDINTINFAIPVTFQPKGDKKSTDMWDMAEYRLHFVPFSGVVTYWGSLGLCTYLTKSKPELTKQCPRVASVMRTGMQTFVAPQLSDYVFNKKNKSNPIEINMTDANEYFMNELNGTLN